MSPRIEVLVRLHRTARSRSWPSLVGLAVADATALSVALAVGLAAAPYLIAVVAVAVRALV